MPVVRACQEYQEFGQRSIFQIRPEVRCVNMMVPLIQHSIWFMRHCERKNIIDCDIKDSILFTGGGVVGGWGVNEEK